MTKDVNKLIEDNIKIAHKLAWEYYKKFNGIIEFEELQSISFLGLTKAANTFNPNLAYTFSTYAYKCVTNEILCFHRNSKKHLKTSLYIEIGNNIILEDLIGIDIKAEEEIYNNLEKIELYKFINELPEIEYKVILYMLQGEKMDDIGKKLNYSQAQISRIYHKALNHLRDKFSNYRKEDL